MERKTMTINTGLYRMGDYYFMVHDDLIIWTKGHNNYMSGVWNPTAVRIA